MKRYLSPVMLVALCLALYLGVVLARAGGDPLAFVRLGAGFTNGVPTDPAREGYDGQFAYYLALDPRPTVVAPHLDVPAYRYQRLLYPLLARGLALGQPALIPWTLVLLGLSAQLAGTKLVEQWLRAYQLSRWYALLYGLWVGLLLAVRLDLSETLGYALCAGALLAELKQRRGLTAVCLALALLAKETALVFWAALTLAVLARGLSVRAAVGLRPLAAGLLPLGLALLPFAFLQVFLYLSFGQWGIGSGGYMATPFEVIPFWGYLQIGWTSAFQVALLAVWGVLIVGPSLWGLLAAARRLGRRDFSPAVWALALNAAVIPFTPFSTFREAGGLLRLATGLVLAVCLYAAQRRSRRTLNYAALLELAGLAFLFKE